MKQLRARNERDPGRYQLTVASTAEAAELIAANKDRFRDFEVVKRRHGRCLLTVTGKPLGGDEK